MHRKIQFCNHPVSNGVTVQDRPVLFHGKTFESMPHRVAKIQRFANVFFRRVIFHKILFYIYRVLDNSLKFIVIDVVKIYFFEFLSGVSDYESNRV